VGKRGGVNGARESWIYRFTLPSSGEQCNFFQVLEIGCGKDSLDLVAKRAGLKAIEPAPTGACIPCRHGVLNQSRLVSKTINYGDGTEERRRWMKLPLSQLSVFGDAQIAGAMPWKKMGDGEEKAAWHGTPGWQEENERAEPNLAGGYSIPAPQEQQDIQVVQPRRHPRLLLTHSSHELTHLSPQQQFHRYILHKNPRFSSRNHDSIGSISTGPNHHLLTRQRKLPALPRRRVRQLSRTASHKRPSPFLNAGAAEECSPRLLRVYAPTRAARCLTERLPTLNKQ
jgi:hypothetical protein